MSSRHIPSSHVRLFDPSTNHSNNSQHMGPPLPHLNGSSTSTTSAVINNNSSNVSPTSAPNGTISSGNASNVVQKLAQANEQTWLLIGRVAEQMGDLDHALTAYESALRHNPNSLAGLTQVAGIARVKENYTKAIDFFQRVLAVDEQNGEVWSALGHCYLMQDELQKAYSAYQQALYLLPNPKEDPKLWYGIGILYDRYGSLDHAEEAFSSVLRMNQDLDFDKANEILFRLGIIYKQQSKYEDSLGCFDRILRNPPSPLAHADIWFQIGHVYEQQKDHIRAKDAYERVVMDNPSHAKVLQQLGWLYHQEGSSFQNQDLAIQYLTKSLEADPADAQSWYLLGRAYMAGHKYNKAYEAYQQAVYRDGRNPTFWCSIGVLYFQINQFRDALDAYSRAIRINPYISEVWFDLGSLYESCNNQISDAIDAYARASELDQSNTVISLRLQLLRTAQATGGALPAAPGPQDVHPTAYASAVVPPNSLGLGGPLLLQSSSNASRPGYRADDNLALPPANVNGRSPNGPFRGGPPPPVIIDEARHAPNHTPLAPMEVDRMHGRAGDREGPHSSLLLHHPVPQQQEDIVMLQRNGTNGHHAPAPPPHQESYFTRGNTGNSATSPLIHTNGTPRSRSPFTGPSGPGLVTGGYPPPLPAHAIQQQRQPSVSLQRSPRPYPAEPATSANRDREREREREDSSTPAWDRRAPHGPGVPPGNDWEARNSRSSRSDSYSNGNSLPPLLHSSSSSQQQSNQQPYYGTPRSPSLHRVHSPNNNSSTGPSPRLQHVPSGPGIGPPGNVYWERERERERDKERERKNNQGVASVPGSSHGHHHGPSQSHHSHSNSVPPSSSHDRDREQPGRRYDPRFDNSDDASGDVIMGEPPSRAAGVYSPVASRHAQPQSISLGSGSRTSESPVPTPGPERRRRAAKDKANSALEKTVDKEKEDNDDVPQKKERKKRVSTTNAAASNNSTSTASTASKRGGKKESLRERTETPPASSMHGHSKSSTAFAMPYDRERERGYDSQTQSNGSSSKPSPASTTETRSPEDRDRERDQNWTRPPHQRSASSRGDPVRVVDEDYDEGVGVDALMGLANSAHRGTQQQPPFEHSQRPRTHSNTSPMRGSHSSAASSTTMTTGHHRNSIDLPSGSNLNLKRQLSLGPDELHENNQNKRSRVDSTSSSSSRRSPPGRRAAASPRRISSPLPQSHRDVQQPQARRGSPLARRGSSPGSVTSNPQPSTRPSPIPFRTQPLSSNSNSRSPSDERDREEAVHQAYPGPSSNIVVQLPPHPRPVGITAPPASNSSSNSAPNSAASHMALPPIAVLEAGGRIPSPRGRDSYRERDIRDRREMHQHSPISPREGGSIPHHSPKQHTPSPVPSNHSNNARPSTSPGNRKQNTPPVEAKIKEENTEKTVSEGDD